MHEHAANELPDLEEVVLGKKEREPGKHLHVQALNELGYEEDDHVDRDERYGPRRPTIHALHLSTIILIFNQLTRISGCPHRPSTIASPL
jgi:hypothetical protein